MSHILQKVKWFPWIEITMNEGSALLDDACPWLEFSEIFPGLYLTCEETICNRVNAQEKGVALILTLNGEDHVAPYRVYEYLTDTKAYKYTKITSFDVFVSMLDEYTSGDIPEDAQSRKVFIRSVTAQDNPMYDISSHFPEMCAFIELVMVNRKNMMCNLSCKPAVAVHCLMGVSRSAAVVVAYLMKRCGYSRDYALSSVRKARAVANPNMGFQTQLLNWGKGGHYRVVDEFTALLVANELRVEDKLSIFLEKQLPLLLLSNSAPGRELFGLVAAKASFSDDDFSAIVATVSNQIALSIDKEEYIDVPGFFQNACEIMASLVRYSPMVLPSSAAAAESLGCFDDTVYLKMFKTLCGSGAGKCVSDIAAAFCSLLEAINTKHLLHNPMSQPRLLNSLDDAAMSSPGELRLSFPFLPFLAPYAAGFIGSRRWETVEVKKATPENGEILLRSVLTTFQESFLLTASGTVSCPDSLSTFSRWHPGSRLQYLEQDMEVQIMESVERGATLSAATSQYLESDHINTVSGLTWVRKLTGGIVGTRLFYDAVDIFFSESYGNLFPCSLVYSIADKVAPWEEIFDILRHASTLYTKRHGGVLDLLLWMKGELEPLISCGMVTIPEH